MSKKNEKMLKYYQDIALSNKEVLELVNNKANIVIYPDLYKYKSIDEVLGPYGAVFILFESKPNYGHWCLLFKINNNKLEFFNPYNGYPDDSLDFIPVDFREKSNQNIPYLSILLYNSPYKLSYNEYDFQKHDKNIKTCGRWCAVRLICRNLSLKQFANLFHNEYGDMIVTLLTIYINK